MIQYNADSPRPWRASGIKPIVVNKTKKGVFLPTLPYNPRNIRDRGADVAEHNSPCEKPGELPGILRLVHDRIVYD
jgi:hypothetical protein